MSLKQTVYFMTLVGAMAGLCCWFLQAGIADLLTGMGQAFQNIITGSLMGALIGGLTVGFADHWGSDRVVVKWVVAGVVLGALAGLVGGLLYLPILSTLMRPNESGIGQAVGRPMNWLIAGGLIGLVTGLRWFGINRLRSVHALLGGLIGGALGGVVFTFLGSFGETFQAISYMLTGMGITCGVTLAPVLLRDGVLQFISSADPRAQNKYGSPQQEWVVQDGDRFTIGSQGSDRNMTMYARPVDIYIPDAMVAKRHAVMFAKAKTFYIQQHPENVGPQGQPLSPLQVNNANVSGTRELRAGDEIIMGQTLLRFYSKRQAPPTGPAAAGRRV
jgi:MFS family permease